jgi:Ankyrin repeats (many copies)
VQRTLDAIPATLDDTYVRILREIPEENSDDAHRLLQCLTVAVRPLRVEELAEVLAIEFPDGGIPKLREDWRWEDQEQAVLLACSSLISIVEDNCSRVVQFSHFSVKEFLISPRLSTLQAASHYHILPSPAHTVMAQACLGVLLRLDSDIDKESIGRFPLADYAAKHWVEHAEFENVISHIGDGIDNLVDRDKPHFAAWLWMRKGAQKMRPKLREAVPLYYIAKAGLCGLVQHIISKHPEDVNANNGHDTPLHVAVLYRHIEVSQLVLEHCEDVDVRDFENCTPLFLASQSGLQANCPGFSPT